MERLLFVLAMVPSLAVKHFSDNTIWPLLNAVMRKPWPDHGMVDIS